MSKYHINVITNVVTARIRSNGAGENMEKRGTNKKPQKLRVKAVTQARIDELIEEATVDCYNESEQISGFFCMLEERLVVPFSTKLLGQEVVVEKVDLTEGSEIVAVCRQGRHRQRVAILDLPLPNPRPDGSEWIEAYRHWARWK